MKSKLLLSAALLGITAFSVQAFNPEKISHEKIMNQNLKQQTDTHSICLFHTPDAKGIPYRIPAILSTPQGRLIAMSDYRYCGADIGFGQIDIVGKYSDDNGKTWSISSKETASKTIQPADMETLPHWPTAKVVIYC